MPSVRKSYDEELLQLDTLLARMGHEAGAAIESALTALRNDDIELARSVVARDSQVDASEHEIEHRCLQLLLRQQPVASDLRKVTRPAILRSWCCTCTPNPPMPWACWKIS